MVIVLLLITFIIGTGSFGFFSYITGINISTPVGTFEIGQILLVIALLTCFLKRKRRKINIKGTVLFPLIFFIFLIILQFFRGLLGGLGLQLSLRGIKGIYMFFYIFPLIILIKNRSQLQRFINYILLIGFISALVAIYQFLTGATLGASQARIFSGGFGRVYHPGAQLMAFCFFISLSHFLVFGLQKKNNWMYVIAPLYIIGVITTLHRSLIGMTIICSATMILIYLFYEGRIRSTWKPIFVSLISIFVLSYFLQKSGFGVEQLLLRGRSAIIEVKYFEGNYAGRWEILLDTFSRIIKESPLIGVGYKHESVANVLGTYYITNDSAYNNLFVLFGLIGLTIWFILLYKIFSISISKYKSTLKSSEDKALYLAISVMPLFYIVIGFFGAIFTYTANLTTLITIIGILYLLNYFQMHKRIGVNTNEFT